VTRFLGPIVTAALAGAISPEAKLLITIIEIGTNRDDIGLRITKARNHQTAVRGVDFAALDPDQERLRQELAISGITYHYRPSAEARARREDAFTLEEAALALACLSFRVLTSQEVQQHKAQGRRVENAVDLAVTAKKEIGRLWEQDGAVYTMLFNPSLSGIRMGRIVNIYRFIDRILASTERSEGTYHRRMFFRHGRYFIMAFVSHRSADLLNRADPELSEADKTALSQSVNDLSEVIYSESTSLQGFKGYLAIFRNLTDSQPLADRVMAKLTERDQAVLQARSAAATASTSTPTGNTA
jgi:hypothetical protein